MPEATATSADPLTGTFTFDEDERPYRITLQFPPMDREAALAATKTMEKFQRVRNAEIVRRAGTEEIDAINVYVHCGITYGLIRACIDQLRISAEADAMQMQGSIPGTWWRPGRKNVTVVARRSASMRTSKSGDGSIDMSPYSSGD